MPSRTTPYQIESVPEFPEVLQIYQIPANSCWQVRYFVDGKYIRRSTGTNDKAEAITKAKELFDSLRLADRLGSICLLGFLLVLGSPLRAQVNIDLGKTPAALFASNCVNCHKSPQGLAKGGRAGGLDSFLREHYTASRESAAAMAAYLQSAGNAPASRRATKGTGKGDDKPKGAEKKPAAGKTGDTKMALATARQNVKVYDAIPPNATPIDQISATACDGTQKVATDKLIALTSQRGGNGIAQLSCTSEGMSFSCWSSATCTAVALTVVGPPVVPIKPAKRPKPKAKPDSPLAPHLDCDPGC